MRDIINRIQVMNIYQAGNAYDQIGGYIHTAVPAITFSAYNQYRDVIVTRMTGFMSGSPQLSALASRSSMLASYMNTGHDSGNKLLAAANSTIPTAKASDWGFWMDAYGSLNERRANDISSRYDHNTAGAVFGFDRKIASSLLLGTSLSYSYTSSKLNSLSENARMSSYQGSIYGIYANGPWYLSGIGSYAYNSYDTSRDMAFGGIIRSANASYKGNLLAGYFGGGYKTITKHVNILPYIALQAARLSRANFTEDDAGALNLVADSEKINSFLASAGVRLSKDYSVMKGVLTPELRIRWDHELSYDNHSLTASFMGYPQASFTVNSDKPDRDRIAAGAGIGFKAKENISLYLAAIFQTTRRSTSARLVWSIYFNFLGLKLYPLSSEHCIARYYWRARQDLNLWPLAPEANALSN
jgi:outer membrane autotransporter protein